MNEQPLDLRRMLRALVRHWVLILVLVWAGCVGGYLLPSTQPATYVARSSVLLPAATADSEGNLTRNISTQVNIARNGNILGRAGRVVNPPLGPRAMRRQITVKALTSDILEVRAEAKTGRDAALLADAVANEYVAEATGISSKLASTATSGLVEQRDDVEKRLRETKAEIDVTTARMNTLPPNEPERARLAAVVDILRLDEVETARQLASLADKLADARLQDRLNREGTRLLSPAIVPSEPSGPKPVVLVVAGAVLGLLGGIALSLFLDRRDDRLRSRAAIAEVVAAPLLASLQTPRRISVGGCRSMLESWEPRPLHSWALRQALLRLRVLHGEPPSNIVVVGLPGDLAGPLIAVQIAVFSASVGTRTALVIATPHRTAARLRAACHRGIGANEVRPYLATRSEPSVSEADGVRPSAELTVSFVIAEAGQTELASIPRGAVTTLGVSSGFASADTLASTALACLDAGHPIVGVFLANPDPADPTGGDPIDMPPLNALDRPVLYERPVVREVGSGGTAALDPEEGLFTVPEAAGHAGEEPVGEEPVGEEPLRTRLVRSRVVRSRLARSRLARSRLARSGVGGEPGGEEPVGEQHADAEESSQPPAAPVDEAQGDDRRAEGPQVEVARAAGHGGDAHLGNGHGNGNHVGSGWANERHVDDAEGNGRRAGEDTAVDHHIGDDDGDDPRLLPRDEAS